MSTIGQGSSGNVIAAVCSFFIPGLGQLVQGRVLAAVLHFVLTGGAMVCEFRSAGLGGTHSFLHWRGALEGADGLMRL